MYCSSLHNKKIYILVKFVRKTRCSIFSKQSFLKHDCLLFKKYVLNYNKLLVQFSSVQFLLFLLRHITKYNKMLKSL